jgi:hypothetical protein
MSFTDAPVPLTSEARMAHWMKGIDEKIHRVTHQRDGYFVVSVSGTTDSQGLITFTHDAGQIPSAILIQIVSPFSPAAWNSMVDSMTDETAQARFISSSGGSVVSYVGSITFKAFVFVGGEG